MTKHPVDVHVGQKIRHRRWLTGMTQQQLASACSIKFQQIQKYENGANRVSASRLYEISNALNVPPEYFFEGLNGEVQNAFHQEQAILEDKDTAELIRAFAKMRKGMRRRMIDLARAIAGEDAEAA